jgi:hypothetical protein
LRLADAWLRSNPGGTQVTLAVLDGLGQARLQALAAESGRTLDTVKKDLGLFVVLVLIDAYGAAHVATLRHAKTGKNSTRTRTAQWQDLPWVSRYTPHRVVLPPAPVFESSNPDGGGFRGGSYASVNREERHFCFLVGHALLGYRAARQGLADLLQTRYPGCILDPDNLQIFVEAAALRDFWHDLGDPVAYDDETGRRRRVVIEALLEHANVDKNVLDQHLLFWTSAVRTKLWSPGRWSLDALREAGLESLSRVKWAFNAKPDFLLTSPGQLVLIEAKLESGVGRSGGYDQLETQRLIGEILVRLVPAFDGFQVTQATLGVQGENSLGWAELEQVLGVPGLDPQTRAGLARAAATGR